VNAQAISYVQRITADPYPQPDYRVCHNHVDLADYLSIGVQDLGCDTESYPDGRPYCVTVSRTPGTGRLVYARDRSTLAWLGAWLGDGGADQLLFHNYLHDVVPMDELDLPIGTFTDTMVRAYNLCLGGGGDDDDQASMAGRGSLGLKQLAYRFLNMRMTSFKDTVFPHSIPHLKRYLYDAQSLFQYEDRGIKRCQCGCLQGLHLVKGKRGLPHGQCTGCRTCDKYRAKKFPPLTEEEERLNRLYRKVTGLVEDIDSGRCERDDEEQDVVNPWKRIKGWHDYDHQALTNELGSCPVPSIAHVPEPELVKYACCDADATLRLYHFLKDYRPWVFYA